LRFNLTELSAAVARYQVKLGLSILLIEPIVSLKNKLVRRFMYTYLLLLGFEKFTVEFGFITLRPEEVAKSSTSASFRASAHHIIRLFEELTAIFQFSIKSIETSRRPFNLRFDKPLTSRI
jgi:hypothetical protein